MKKIFCFVLMMILAIGLVGCGAPAESNPELYFDATAKDFQARCEEILAAAQCVDVEVTNPKSGNYNGTLMSFAEPFSADTLKASVLLESNTETDKIYRIVIEVKLSGAGDAAAAMPVGYAVIVGKIVNEFSEIENYTEFSTTYQLNSMSGREEIKGEKDGYTMVSTADGKTSRFEIFKTLPEQQQ